MNCRARRSIIVVEDSEEDYKALQWASKAASIEMPLVRCESGEEGIECLHGRGKYKGAFLQPGLVLLDLNLPRMSGKEVLRYIKTCDQLKSLPVVIFSSSAHSKDVSECYRDGASSYIVKPLGLTQLSELMKTLTQYWFQTVEPAPEVETWKQH